MSWSTAPTLPERKTGPAWTTAATLPTRQGGAGWFTLIERVGQLGGSGVLSAAVGTTYPHTTTALSGTGTLSAAITTIRTVAVAFTGSGSLTGELRQTRSVTASFTGSGGMAAAVNDGLWGIIDGGTRVTDGLSGVITGGATDGLSGTITPVATHEAAAAFSTEGALAASAFSSTGTPALLTATGVLAATGTPQYTITGSFTVTGMLTAPIYPLYSRDAALSGVGVLAATVESGLVSESRNADFTGAGVLAATAIPSLTAAAAFTSTGALAATGTAAYTRSAALTGTGVLAATGIAAYASAPAFTSTGTLSATATKAVTPLAYVNSASAATTTVAMPAHVAGDLLIAWVWRDGSTTAPTIPAGWMATLVVGTGTTCWGGVYLKIAQSAAETTGTWTGATHVAVAVYRSGNGIAGAYTPARGQASSATITYPAVTLEDTLDKSWVARFAGHRTATNMTTNTPAGYTNRTANADIRIIDSNAPVTTNPTADTQAVNATSGWIAGSMEILDATNTTNFSDDFNTGSVPDTARWVVHNEAGGAVSLTSGRLRLSPTGFTGVGVLSRAMFPMTGRTAAVQIATTPTASLFAFGVVAGEAAVLSTAQAYTSTWNGLLIVGNGTWPSCDIYKVVGGGPVASLGGFTGVVGNYYRFREAAGTYYVDTSTTGSGSWTNLWSTTFTVPLAGRFIFNTVAVGSAVQTEYDNFSLT